MTSDRESTPFDKGHSPAPPHHGGMQSPTARPVAVTIAAVLWGCMGGLLALTALAYPMNPGSAYSTTTPVIRIFLLCYGAAMIIGAARMVRGSYAGRNTATIMGCLLLWALWPLVFIIPALILQNRRNSRAWFRAVNAAVRG